VKKWCQSHWILSNVFFSEIAILKQLVPGDCQNIAGFLKLSTFLSDMDPNYLANSSFG
jgi:hypothetical protein